MDNIVNDLGLSHIAGVVSEVSQQGSIQIGALASLNITDMTLILRYVRLPVLEGRSENELLWCQPIDQDRRSSSSTRREGVQTGQRMFASRPIARREPAKILQ